jgi:hypothetical protein
MAVNISTSIISNNSMFAQNSDNYLKNVKNSYFSIKQLELFNSKYSIPLPFMEVMLLKHPEKSKITICEVVGKMGLGEPRT